MRFRLHRAAIVLLVLLFIYRLYHHNPMAPVRLTESPPVLQRPISAAGAAAATSDHDASHETATSNSLAAGVAAAGPADGHISTAAQTDTLETVVQGTRQAEDGTSTPTAHVASKFLGPVGPDPALGAVLTTTGPRKGLPCVDCIFVGVTICCKTWNRTEKLLTQLLASDDNMHIVVFDDMSEDDSKGRAEALSLAVMQPPKLKNIGLTQMMNLMWRYYYARPELQSMFVVNNDLEISPFRTFEKLNNCLQSIQVRPERRSTIHPVRTVMVANHAAAPTSRMQNSRGAACYHDTVSRESSITLARVLSSA